MALLCQQLPLHVGILKVYSQRLLQRLDVLVAVAVRGHDVQLLHLLDGGENRRLVLLLVALLWLLLLLLAVDMHCISCEGLTFGVWRHRGRKDDCGKKIHVSSTLTLHRQEQVCARAHVPECVRARTCNTLIFLMDGVERTTLYFQLCPGLFRTQKINSWIVIWHLPFSSPFL